jgi:hypothetical protein
MIHEVSTSLLELHVNTLVSEEVERDKHTPKVIVEEGAEHL